MSEIDGIVRAKGLTSHEAECVEELVDIYNRHLAKNATKRSYYNGTATAKDIGINAIPDMAHVSVSCDWPRKAVSSLAERSRFDGFVFDSGEGDELLNQVSRDCRLPSRYRRNINSELVHGCMAATVGNAGGMPYVRFHSAEQCALVWDIAHERLGMGLCIADAKRTSYSGGSVVPTQVNMHLPGSVVVFNRIDAVHWAAESYTTGLDRPMMVAFAHAGTGDEPLGKSRITKTVRDISDEAMRAFEYMSVSAALNSAPQKYMLGLTRENFEAFMSNKNALYLGSWVLASADEDTGAHPTIGQLQATGPDPYIAELRALAALFSGVTGVPLNSLGIIQDNPTSAESIVAAREDISVQADDLNDENGESLRDVALLAMAVANNCGVGELPAEVYGARAHFKQTVRTTKSQDADAALKLAQAVPGFAQTPEFWEQYGLEQSDVERIMADLLRVNVTDQLVGISAALGNSNEQ